MTNTTEIETLAWPEGHFTSVGIPTPFGYLTRCKCGQKWESDTMTGAWALSTRHQETVWAMRD